MFQSQFLYDVKAIKKETDDFAVQRMARAPFFTDEEGLKGHIVKEKIEKFEAQICSPFEMPEDVKLEMKCEERQVSQVRAELLVLVPVDPL